MFIRIEKASSVPISRQIADQIRAQCLAGIVKPGHQLASVRQLARELAVNQNTILRVYERLTAEGLLTMRHGDGTYVTAKSSARSLRRHRNTWHDELLQLLRRGRMLGLTNDELRAQIRDALREAGKSDLQPVTQPTTLKEASS